MSEIIKQNFENGHEWVDLGLPGGTKWATCNIGAKTPEKFGTYFAWGEVKGKRDYRWETYKFAEEFAEGEANDDDDDYKIIKYSYESGMTVLAPEDDAATVLWGGRWRMPTWREFNILIKGCHWERVYVHGVKCLHFTSKENGNSIFLPCAGDMRGTEHHPEGCSYWTSEVDDYDAMSWYFEAIYNNAPEMYMDGWRYRGRSIRPVLNL